MTDPVIVTDLTTLGEGDRLRIIQDVIIKSKPKKMPSGYTIVDVVKADGKDGHYRFMEDTKITVFELIEEALRPGIYLDADEDLFEVTRDGDGAMVVHEIDYNEGRVLRDASYMNNPKRIGAIT